MQKWCQVQPHSPVGAELVHAAGRYQVSLALQRQCEALVERRTSLVDGEALLEDLCRLCNLAPLPHELAILVVEVGVLGVARECFHVYLRRLLIAAEHLLHPRPGLPHCDVLLAVDLCAFAVVLPRHVEVALKFLELCPCQPRLRVLGVNGGCPPQALTRMINSMCFELDERQGLVEIGVVGLVLEPPREELTGEVRVVLLVLEHAERVQQTYVVLVVPQPVHEETSCRVDISEPVLHLAPRVVDRQEFGVHLSCRLVQPSRPVEVALGRLHVRQVLPEDGVLRNLPQAPSKDLLAALLVVTLLLQHGDPDVHLAVLRIQLQDRGVHVHCLLYLPTLLHRLAALIQVLHVLRVHLWVDLYSPLHRAHVLLHD
mmetsp:Transcript_4702/g.14201  ORF Transcript_4702/g.14201 Transcript_4702/m.14201 type:complete len:372 (-) Transcript_4702:139-1254(-)